MDRNNISAIMMKGDHYLVVEEFKGNPYITEQDFGASLETVVHDIVTGQYDVRDDGPIAVIRVNFKDGEAEDVTNEVCLRAAAWITSHAESKDDVKWNCPFLDYAWPKWKAQAMAEWEAETGYMDDYPRPGRYAG